MFKTVSDNFNVPALIVKLQFSASSYFLRTFAASQLPVHEQTI